ncbi:MAG: hypothetical protein L0K82_04485, partial [Pisciglobus halotolerans]|nr:hypothetical protein [Pisciglobus halotolerans]
MDTGHIVQVIGPVVDVEFPLDGKLPEINDALIIEKTKNDNKKEITNTSETLDTSKRI